MTFSQVYAIIPSMKTKFEFSTPLSSPPLSFKVINDGLNDCRHHVDEIHMNHQAFLDFLNLHVYDKRLIALTFNGIPVVHKPKNISAILFKGFKEKV